MLYWGKKKKQTQSAGTSKIPCLRGFCLKYIQSLYNEVPLYILQILETRHLSSSSNTTYQLNLQGFIIYKYSSFFPTCVFADRCQCYNHWLLRMINFRCWIADLLPKNKTNKNKTIFFFFTILFQHTWRSVRHHEELKSYRWKYSVKLCLISNYESKIMLRHQNSDLSVLTIKTLLRSYGNFRLFL